MFIRTRRLMLRPVFPEDWREVYAGLGHLGIVRMLARAPWPYTADHAREYCARQRDPSAMQFAITVPGAAGAPLIGQIGINQDDPDAAHELGYWIAGPWQRCGYASEALHGVLATAAALGIACIEAGHFEDNPASGKVLRCCGFEPTGEVVPTASAGRAGEPVSALRYRRTLSPEPGTAAA